MFQYIQAKKGVFIDIDTGKTVGEHGGLHKWTVGQRCCLANSKHPYFVFKKDLNSNDIYVVILYIKIDYFLQLIYSKKYECCYYGLLYRLKMIKNT